MADTRFGPNGWTPERIGSLAGKTFVITGTTAGTGFEAARILLSKAAKLVMLNRNPDKAANTLKVLKDEFGADADVINLKMDLAVQESVRDAAVEVLANVDHIDALICNAAIAQVPNHKLTADGFESQIGTNHYGHFTLCASLSDLIEKSKGRIVVVASLGYKLGLKTIQFDDMNWDNNYHANKTYCHSKLAQMMIAYELQDKVKAAGKHSKAYVCHPGASSTSLIDTSGGFITKMMWNLMQLFPIVQSAEKGAYGQVMCATEENLEQRAFYGPTGRMETTGPVGAGTLEPYAVEKPVMSKLWTVTEEILDVKWSI